MLHVSKIAWFTVAVACEIIMENYVLKYVAPVAICSQVTAHFLWTNIHILVFPRMVLVLAIYFVIGTVTHPKLVFIPFYIFIDDFFNKKIVR